MDAVIVTGAAGGIGRGLVRAFRDAGYAVLSIDRVPPPDHFPGEEFLQADLAATVEDAGYASEVFGSLRRSLEGRSLKALVNNAAVQVVSPVEDFSREDWAGTLRVNVVAPFLWTQAFLPELERAGGMVLNISSIHARLTKPGFVAYATSKAALSGLTRALAVELGGRVRVNAIEPAAIDTEMLRAGFAGKPEAFSRLSECHPTGRIGTPEEVARVALVLVDGKIPFLNGASVALDGGVGSRLHDTA